MAKYYYSPAKQRVALLLMAGVTLALSRSPKIHMRVIKNLPKAWKSINRKVLYRTLREFKRDRLVDFKQLRDGTAVIVLTERGEKFALRFKIDEISIKKPLRWDKKWRVVIFDIPEKRKKAREAFRAKLMEMGFVQLQKSIWVYPYPCRDEINFIVEIFEIRNFVHYLETIVLANDTKLKLHFHLS